jgi:hypothetical protein
MDTQEKVILVLLTGLNKVFPLISRLNVKLQFKKEIPPLPESRTKLPGAK